MQFLWKYVDDILGKGYTILDIGEMIIYFMITQIPMALPISILLSSVMVYGALAEKFEISSMKSAGVSLIRIMQPGIMLAVFTAILSLMASNIFKPQANFQFQKRIKSIRNQKPALVIEEKIFNKDFANYSIRVDKKLDDNESIEDILIYDHSQVDKSLLNMTTAEKGRMYTGEGGAFVMELFNGTQYSELKRDYTSGNKKKYPMMRTSFDRWQKVFNTEEFNTDDFSVNINRNKEDMLNVFQLKVAIDTIDSEFKGFRHDFTDRFSMDFNPETKDERLKPSDQIRDKKSPGIPILTDVKNPTSISDYLDKKNRGYITVMQDAKDNTSLMRDRGKMVQRNLTSNRYKRKKYLLRLHQQFSFAFICIVFMFLGAPLGSIIRKGGFGYPLLYAIGFYMTFIMLAIMGEKLARSESMDPILAAWISNVVLLPIALYLTYLALRDAKTTIFGRIRDAILGLFPKKEEA